jgi:TPP-dependent pyruvate/acetoin dehydrogenase alpha subunit
VTAKGTDSKAAWENPLIPNAKLRQIYVAMMQARSLARVVPARRRNNATLGIEACLVSPAIDLGAGDLVSDALGGGVIEFLRGAMLVEVLGSEKISRRRGVTADCGEAARLPEAPGVTERIWAALGAAAALKAASARIKVEAKAAGNEAKQPGVVVVYALPGEATTAVWQKTLTFAREKQLPVLFVILPSTPRKGNTAKAAGLCALAILCGVPGIAVDADDAVALYRVAQESIGHARIGGGPALMECVPFVLQTTESKRRPATDAITGLERYLLQRGVASRAWIEREAKSFAKRAEVERAASK